MDDSSEDFAALFEASITTRRIEQGQTLDGTVVAIGPEVAFVDVGGKGEATIDLSELRNEAGDLAVAVGERLRAVVVSTAGGIKLSRRLALSAATTRQIEDAFRSGLPVEGKVTGPVKGGYEVRIGHQRAFCPGSQIDVHPTDPASHTGRVYQFRIIEHKDGGRTVVVSRRALLEEAQKAQAAKVRESIVAGAIVTGRVVSLREFGAFVDFGGVQGLLHVADMGWARISDPSHVVTMGQEITVKVLSVDDRNQRISLGLKQLADDPWSRVPDAYAVGQVHPGRIVRVTEFGAFVELEPGIEALAHASTFPPTGRHDGWTDGVSAGTTCVFEILSIDLERKRIGVALVPEGSSRGAPRDTAHLSSDADGVEPGASFGSLADKLRSALEPRRR